MTAPRIWLTESTAFGKPGPIKWQQASTEPERAERAAAWFQHRVAVEVTARMEDEVESGGAASMPEARTALGDAIGTTQLQVWRKLGGQFFFTLPELIGIVRVYGADVAPVIESGMGPS
jgi:hypothetical protein